MTFTRKSAAFAALLLIAGCSLEPKKGPALQLRIEPETASAPARLEFAADANPIQAMSAPSTLDSFACLGVNVTGPGIADSSIHEPETDLGGIFARLVAGERCSYRGVIAGPFYRNVATNSFTAVDASMSIPAGAGRMIQVLGVTDPVACASAFQEEDPGVSGPRYYEVARAFLPSLFSSQSVSLNTSWNSLDSTQQDAQSVDCGDGDHCTVDTNTSEDLDFSINTGGAQSMFAFRFQIPSGGAYLGTFRFKGRTSTSASMTAAVYPDTGAGDPDTGASVIATTTISGISGTDAIHSASFGAGLGVFISTPGYYWVVLKTPTALVNLRYNGMGSPDGNAFRYYTGSTFTAFTNGLPWFETRVCQ